MRRGLLVVLACLTPALAQAATYYVDNSCSTNGTGTTDSCGGASGRINSASGLQTTLSAAVAGDTIVVHVGSAKYVTSNVGGDPSVNGGFVFGHDGTSVSRITLRAATGEHPILANCSTQATYCNHPTVTNNNHEYVMIDGLTIEGGIWTSGSSTAPDTGARGLVITNNDISTGWGEVGDGNWAGIFLYATDGAQINHNYIHDILVPSGGGGQDSGVAVKYYNDSDAIFEYNTIKDVTISESQVEGIDDKAEGTRNIFRYNHISGVTTCFRLNSQLGGLSIVSDQLYGNVCVGDVGTPRGCFRLTVKVSSADIYNNTCYGFAMAVFTEAGPLTNIKFYNNIMAGATSSNVESYVDLFISPTNYNAWTSGENWIYPSHNAANLAAWQSSGLGWDANSHTTACSFTSAPTDLTLTGGTCQTGGRTGGTSGGSTIEQGAYGVTTCVGYTCGATAAAPTVTFVSPSSGTTLGGTSVAITGTEFVDTPTVTMNNGGGGVSIPCTSVHVTSSTQIECTTGAGSAQTLNVTVTNPDTQSGTLVNGFTYTVVGSPGTSVMRLRAK